MKKEIVRAGILIPHPAPSVVYAFCALASAQIEDVQRFQIALRTAGPSFVEYQFLNEGFGYGVYKEGFDIIFHFAVGQEFGTK